MDIKCAEAEEGGYYYPDHLPVLGKGREGRGQRREKERGRGQERGKERERGEREGMGNCMIQ